MPDRLGGSGPLGTLAAVLRRAKKSSAEIASAMVSAHRSRCIRLALALRGAGWGGRHARLLHPPCKVRALPLAARTPPARCSEGGTVAHGGLCRQARGLPGTVAVETMPARMGPSRYPADNSCPTWKSRLVCARLPRCNTIAGESHRPAHGSALGALRGARCALPRVTHACVRGRLRSARSMRPAPEVYRRSPPRRMPLITAACPQGRGSWRASGAHPWGCAAQRLCAACMC